MRVNDKLVSMLSQKKYVKNHNKRAQTMKYLFCRKMSCYSALSFSAASSGKWTTLSKNGERDKSVETKNEIELNSFIISNFKKLNSCVSLAHPPRLGP